MRSFKDNRERNWDVALGRESYGTLVLIFSRRGVCEVRRSVLRASTRLAAEAEFQALGESELRNRLATSEPWT